MDNRINRLFDRSNHIRSIYITASCVYRYCIDSKEDYVEYLLAEDQAISMNFFDWMWRTSKTKLLQSYDEYWRRLCQYFSLFARRGVNDDVHKQMRRVSYVLCT